MKPFAILICSYFLTILHIKIIIFILIPFSNVFYANFFSLSQSICLVFGDHFSRFLLLCLIYNIVFLLVFHYHPAPSQHKQVIHRKDGVGPYDGDRSHREGQQYKHRQQRVL